MMQYLLQRQILFVLSMFLGIFVVGGAGYVLHAVSVAREAARQTACRGRMCQLNLALMNYHEYYGSFPPAYIADVDGKPMHSWRVLILPFLDGADLYAQYRFDEPWNSPHNLKLADTRRSNPFSCPSGPDPDHSVFTDYVVIVGPDTAFPGAKTTNTGQFQDGIENTILISEVQHSNIHWMEPRDLSVDSMSFQTNDPKQSSISSPHPNGPAVAFGDVCGGFRLRPSIRPETLKAMTTIAGHEPVVRDKLIDSSDSKALRE